MKTETTEFYPSFFILSFNPATATNQYKFNGDYYEKNSDFYNYLTTFRSYDPAIAKWNQLDPMNQYANGYLAYGADPVSYADPSGTICYKNSGGSAGSDNPTSDSPDPLNMRNVGGGSFTSSSGEIISDQQLIQEAENLHEYNSLDPDVKKLLAPYITNSDILNGVRINAWFKTVSQGGYSTTTFDGYQIIVDGKSNWIEPIVGDVTVGGNYDNLNTAFNGAEIVTSMVEGTAEIQVAEGIRYAQRGLSISEDVASFGRFAKGIGVLGVGLTAANAIYKVSTGQDNTSTWADVGITVASFGAIAIFGTAAAPFVATAGFVYAFWSIAGGSDWIDENWGYRKR